jgi:predicted DsbA family dithiol-disulfide isomerase
MSLTVTEYTDAACPWAWSAEPMKLRLRWLYGDQLTWVLRMIGLTSDREEYGRRGYTPEQMAQGYAMFAERYGMPLETAPRPRLGATVPACRAVVAARLHAPEHEEALLRRLRVRAMTTATGVLDEPETIAAAAREAGLDPAELERWVADPDVERQLAEDMALTRDPAPPAIAMKHKLAQTPQGGWRYTAPSLVFTREDGAALDTPGFQPSLAYENAVANLAPELERRDEPASVEELLAWAPFPLATREVAEVMGIASLIDARHALVDSGAAELRAGTDAFWALEPAAAAVA